jgi:hypothetical protein
MLDHYILRRCDEAFASFDKEIALTRMMHGLGTFATWI